MASVSTDIVPTTFPVLKASSVEARSIDIAWTYGGRDPRHLFNNLTYQLSMTESEAMNFDVLYEGFTTKPNALQEMKQCILLQTLNHKLIINSNLEWT